ncbi:MAG: hypothetical protein K8H88_15610 [Sandaracinaceae bacterium]|nr:hypothetical protein [Sandaracinaceae bacterium]
MERSTPSARAISVLLALASGVALTSCHDASGSAVLAAVDEQDRDLLAGVIVLAPNPLAPGTYAYGTPHGAAGMPGAGFSRDLRFAGGFLSPETGFVIGGIVEGASPSERCTAFYRVRADAATGAFLEDERFCFEPGTAGMRGMSATSFQDDEGNMDTMFAWSDDGVIRASIYDGEAAVFQHAPSTIVASGSEIDFSVGPAIEVGRNDSGDRRILLAHPVLVDGMPALQIGFVEPTGSEIAYASAGLVPLNECDGPSPEGETSIAYNISAAFDASREEYGIALLCLVSGGWSALAIRLDWWGVPVGAWFTAHRGAGDGHSGSLLSYNSLTDTYFFQFEHNSALLTPTGEPELFTCSRVSASDPNCATVLPGFPSPLLENGGVWASSVDYREGMTFRVAAELAPGSASSGDGVLTSQVQGAAPPDWEVEPGTIWDARDTSVSSTAVHAIVRGPEIGKSLLVFLDEHSAGAGFIRYSIADDVSAVPIEE